MIILIRNEVIMRTATHARTMTYAHKRNGKQATKLLRPIKKANKKLLSYVSHKPTQSIGIATLLTGLCVGLVYAKRLLK
jgi:ElaB/YqjD/DUF883 family membrane-anchored ribosome-binding protein